MVVHHAAVFASWLSERADLPSIFCISLQVFSVYVGYDFEATVNVVPNLTGWSWSKRKCHIPMRVALRGERFPESDDTWVAAWVGSLLWAIHFKDGYCQGKLLFGADWQGARGCIGGELCIVFWRYSC